MNVCMYVCMYVCMPMYVCMIKDNIMTNPNLNNSILLKNANLKNSILLKSVSYCYLHCLLSSGIFRS